MKILRDPAFWQCVREKDEYAEFRKLIRQNYEENRFDGSIPEISFKTWLRSETDGDLQEFWSVYFRRRKCLSYGALMALIFPEEPRYIEEISDVIWAICGDSDEVERECIQKQTADIEQIRNAGGDATLTVLEGNFHAETEANAYTKEVFEWMLAQ